MSESGAPGVDSVPEEVRRLRAQVFQLKNIIKKLTGQENSEADVNEDRSKKRRKERKFDFSLYKKRHVLFKVSYFGWDYHGFAVQEITGKTIESELFRALAVTRLIESRETSNYHRCGRTDKGVSAFSQIIVSVADSLVVVVKLAYAISRLSLAVHRRGEFNLVGSPRYPHSTRRPVETTGR